MTAGPWKSVRLEMYDGRLADVRVDSIVEEDGSVSVHVSLGCVPFLPFFFPSFSLLNQRRWDSNPDETLCPFSLAGALRTVWRKEREKGSLLSSSPSQARSSILARARMEGSRGRSRRERWTSGEQAPQDHPSKDYPSVQPESLTTRHRSLQVADWVREADAVQRRGHASFRSSSCLSFNLCSRGSP